MIAAARQAHAHDFVMVRSSPRRVARGEDTSGAWRAVCVPKGERLILSRLKVAKMTHAQIAGAQRMEGEWKPK